LSYNKPKPGTGQTMSEAAWCCCWLQRSSRFHSRRGPRPGPATTCNVPTLSAGSAPSTLQNVLFI